MDSVCAYARMLHTSAYVRTRTQAQALKYTQNVQARKMRFDRAGKAKFSTYAALATPAARTAPMNFMVVVILTPNTN